MLDQEADVRETVGMALCALLSMVAFGAVLFLLGSGRLPVALVIAISLACPVVWLAFLLRSDREIVGPGRRHPRKTSPRRHLKRAFSRLVGSGLQGVNTRAVRFAWLRRIRS